MRAKNIFTILKGLSLILFLGLVACEGDVGPAGPAGPSGTVGPQGPQGVAGVDGQNGAENCADCHGSSQLITAKVWQWENSVHALGGHSERNRADCAGCHTSQGFLDRIATGGTVASKDIENPLPQNCYTCHMIHQSYTSDDWARTAVDPVTLWIGGATVDIGEGNQCVNCHQTRAASSPYVTVADTGILTLTSSRYGPHHGPQGTMLTGNNGYEIGDGYTNSFHGQLVENGCVTCHMAPTSGGRQAGGHTFRVREYDPIDQEFGDINTSGCVECHPDEDELETKIEDAQSDIESLLAELKVLLVAEGVLTEANRTVTGDYDAELIGLLWNYQYVREDQSKGVHNYKYAKTLLENSIAAFTE